MLVPHSHDAADSIDDALESSAAGIRAVKISLLALGVTAMIQVMIVVVSGSVALLADSIHNVADALTAVPLWIAFAVGTRPATRRYTYGFGRAEDVEDAAAFDHVVVLRSYQHFERVPDALGRLFAALRPGGSLFVVDDAPFGLLRTPAQIARAQRGTARLEHRRRDVARDAVPKIEAAGFVVDEVREVGPRTSTLWWVRARRPG